MIFVLHFPLIHYWGVCSGARIPNVLFKAAVDDGALGGGQRSLHLGEATPQALGRGAGTGEKSQTRRLQPKKRLGPPVKKGRLRVPTFLCSLFW